MENNIEIKDNSLHNANYISLVEEAIEKLKQIWIKILDIDDIGEDDNFFEIGGNSLKILQLECEIEKEFNVEILIEKLFECLTINELAKHIVGLTKCEHEQIKPVECKEYYKLSSAQKRLFILNKINSNNKNYNMPYVLIFDGDIDKDYLESVFQKLVDRHESFRTYFDIVDEEPVQRICTEIKFKLNYIEASESDLDNEIQNFIQPFNLSQAPLFRANLVRFLQNKYALMIDMHHIISDGVSMSIIIDEFIKIFKGKELEPIKFQYKDFVEWQSQLVASERIISEEKYWTEKLSGKLPVLNLPYDYQRMAQQSFEGESIKLNIDKITTNRLKTLAKENDCTLYVMLLSAFNILLNKYTGDKDILVGSPIAGRTLSEFQDIVGMFVNTLVLRNYVDEDLTYQQFLIGVKENVLRAFENQNYQFDELVDKLNIKRDLSRNPIFDVAFVWNNTQNPSVTINDVKVKPYMHENYGAKFDLSLIALEPKEEIELRIEYCTSLFKKETIKKMLQSYKRILEQISENGQIKICDITCITEEEREKVLLKFNDTDVRYFNEKTIQQLFEEQVEKTPNNLAITFEGEKLTYSELNKKVNNFARLLRNKGVKPDSIVGVMLEKSPEMIIGIMAILKAGGAYLPIDPSYPRERIEYMLTDSKSKILLSTRQLSNNIQFDGEIIEVLVENLSMNNCDNLCNFNKSNDLAYIIYTSGTTGNPKGVMIEHKCLNNYIAYAKTEYGINEGVNMPLYTSISFDLTVTSIFTPLLSGGIVSIYRDDSIDKVMNKVFDNDYESVIKLTPSHLSLLKEMKNISKKVSSLIVGGEDLTEDLAKYIHTIFEGKTEIINEYGPTEATVGCIVHKYNSSNDYRNSVLIGKPINNTKIYILDNKKSILPIGVTGEIYISGDGLARGYLNREELTAEKFVDNPFEIGKKMYKTGDLARWLENGEIEYLGRIDNQVKIRGFRIEIGEIENRLLQHECIKDVAVSINKVKDNEKSICAYIVSDKTLDELNLKSYLKKILPDYMVPSYFVKLDKIPLTNNGKLDIKSLPIPEIEINLNEYEAPRTVLEETLVNIWSEVLGIENIGINHNFFELGGHSLKATAVVFKLQKLLNKNIELNDIFKFPTIKELSVILENIDESFYSNISKVESKQYYETSSAQKRMYMLQQFDKESIAYNMPVVLELEGNIDKVKIEETFKKLILRHETLRTYFDICNDELVQKIYNDYEFKLPIQIDNNELGVIISDFIRPFNLEKDVLFRIKLIENKGKVYLLIDIHHIIADGMSIEILIKDFSHLYDIGDLDPLSIQYKDFATWQNKILNSEELLKQEKYWIEVFKDGIPTLHLPYDYERPVVQNMVGDNVTFEVDEILTQKLRKIGKENKCTMHMVLLSAFNILLSKYSGQEDIIIGMPIAGRTHKDIQNVMGMFVNTLALRNKPMGEKKYIDFLREVRENCINAYENQSYQFETLVEKLKVERDTSRNPLFDVMFNMIDTVKANDIKLSDMVIKHLYSEERVSKFDLTLNALEEDNRLKFSIEYCSKIFSEHTVGSFSKHYVNVLNSITKNQEVKLFDIDLLTEEEERQILYDFNKTTIEYPKYKTIHEVFEEQVEKTPDNIAVVFNDQKLTYRELNERSNSVARALRNRGVTSSSVIGIIMDRYIDMIVAIMGTLKSGAAYLPIDSNYPQNRIEYILEDSKCYFVITSKSFNSNIKADIEFVFIEDNELYLEEKSNLPSISNAEDLAYIIYTSGSTGNPKGVLIKQKSVVNLCKWLCKAYKINEDTNVLQSTSLSFDVSVEEIFGTLLNGGKLYIITDYDLINKDRFRNFINRNSINMVQMVPSRLNQLIIGNDKMTSITTLICGGDALPAAFKNNVIDLGYNLYNCYGPTETTVDAITSRCMKGEQVVIGQPIDNTRVYIVDTYGKIVPISVWGEICIAGEGLSIGYLNNQKLTAEKFVENPFSINEKMYRTGDLARWLPNGNIEFLGRIDNQVKIRGVRIELDEIENQLLKNQYVKQVVVIAKEKSEKYLCAYVVTDKTIEELNLRSYLKAVLPVQMIPSYFVKIDKIPLTINGKVDKNAFPEPTFNLSLDKYEEPRNPLEEALVTIWSEVLNVNKIGINDNFFDLGGHSLKAMALISKIHKELNKSISIKEMFSAPTIKELSFLINNSIQNVFESMQLVGEKEYYEVSSAQKRMYILQQFDKESIAYNMPIVLEIKEQVSRKKIEDTFGKLVTRHEALRTYFQTIGDELVQKVDGNFEFKIKETMDERNIKEITKEFIKPFDLEKGFLFRVELIKSCKKNYLLIDMHHIISDGVSMEILINEFATLYNGKNLEPLKFQYRDFAAWQNNFLKSDEIKKQEEYWMNVFCDEIPVLNMPIDYERPAVQSFEGDSVDFQLDNNIAYELKELTKKTGTTMYMILLSAFNILLSKYSGQEDIVIGTPIAGRQHADLQNIMGMFVNTLALRNKPEGNIKYIEFLNKVKENALKAYDNQNYQLEVLIEKLDIVRDISRNPLFDVMFNMVDTLTNTDIKFNDMSLISYDDENKVAKFDLTLNTIFSDGKLSFSIQYCSKLFKKETIERLGNHYIKVLETIVNNNQIELGNIDLLSEKEKSKILHDFNDTKVDYTNNSTLQELFEAQVEITPDNIAVVFEDKMLTYKELNEKSNRLAMILRNKGAKPNSIVAIMVERSLDMAVGIMGIIKSGAAYLPIDPTYPKPRIEYMLEDSKSKLLLSKDELADNIEFSGEIIDLFNEDLFKGNLVNLDNINSSSDLAYVIYTSGTTGKPKGVLISHQSLTDTLLWRKQEYKLSERHVILPIFNYVFDGFVINFFAPIISGSKVVLVNDYEMTDPYKLVNYIKTLGVTHYISVPSIYSAILNILNRNDLETLKIVTLAGEKMTPKIVEDTKKLKANIEIVNEYGPTENTVVTTIMRDVQSDKKISIGKPISNTKVYILSSSNKLQPIGVPGEVFIGGSRLAKGYLNRPELDAERFIESIYDEGEMLYRTGDYARWLPDGSIDFIDRIDNQVKIRGFRIELGEIENRLSYHEDVSEVAVLAIENKDKEKYICAYVVSEKEIHTLNLQRYLKENLPAYMVPSRFIKLDKMPVTNNGKIDRKALPKPNLDELITSYEAPTNQTEELLVEIWKEILNIKQVGVNDNFFEIGGHSLKAMTLISKIHKKTNKEVPLKELFNSPTIKGLSKFIDGANENIYSNIEKIEEKEYYEASSAQKRMYIIQGFDKESTAYNMPQNFELQGVIDKAKIEDTFKKLVERHEALRTYFTTVEDEIVQKIDNNYRFKLTEKTSEQSIKLILNDFIKPFDLGKAPLFRAEIVEAQGKNYLLIDMHHIISDGVSMSILINEFATLYNGGNLEPVKLQYKDFAEWQNNFLKKEEIANQEQYWTSVFDGDLPVLDLPYDYERPSTKSLVGSSIGIEIDKEVTSKLKEISRRTGATMHMIVLSAFNILLSKYSGQEDIVIGIPIAGRRHSDLESVMGVFVNTLALRNKPERDKKYIDFLKEVKENSLKAYENQDYQIEALISKLNVERNQSRNPLFDVVFNTLNMEKVSFELDGMVFKSVADECKTARFDLSLSLIEGIDDIQLNLVYCCDLFSIESIELMRDYFIDILKKISNNDNLLLKDMLNDEQDLKNYSELDDEFYF